MKKIKLALGIHNHQPVGNFDFVFEDAYHKAYLPFLEALERHPQVKIAQHYTGILFEWILNRYPAFVHRLRALVQRGQVEMMTGGYYEPILINIPDQDKLGQIHKLTQFVREQTGYDPKGMWLAERIWEPQLPSPLAAADIQYTLVDDSHFKTAGLLEQDLYGYYLTEDTGHVISIFPISEKLRYTIPFQEPEVTIDYLRSIAAEDENRLIVFADDGEKFGVWPGTHEHCYGRGWLDRFFTALEAHADWIELVHFTEASQRLLPLGNVYLPTASYREMMEWALPSKAIHQYEEFEHQLKDKNLFETYKVFVRGGFWRNFLAKYPESNNLHKKALYVSEKISSIKKTAANAEQLRRAQDHLWAGQCNCPYWHGIFGGLYLNNLRNAVYTNMIRAEALADQLVRNDKAYQKGWIEHKELDFDANGRKEVMIETKIFNLYFAPEQGGSLFEMDYKPRPINLLDTMTRREEGYHRKLLAMRGQQDQQQKVISIHDLVVAKEENLDRMLFYDWYRRCSLIDHFMGPATSIQDMLSSRYREEGDFVLERYEHETKRANDQLHIRMWRRGTVSKENDRHALFLEKTAVICANSPELEFYYHLQNLEDEPVDLWFSVEFNFALLAGNAPDRNYYFTGHTLDRSNLASTGSVEHVTSMGLKDEWLRLDLQLEFKDAATVWRFPVETISQSEGGFERVYQSSVVLPNWKIRLPAKGSWKTTIINRIVNL